MSKYIYGIELEVYSPLDRVGKNLRIIEAETKEEAKMLIAIKYIANLLSDLSWVEVEATNE